MELGQRAIPVANPADQDGGRPFFTPFRVVSLLLIDAESFDAYLDTATPVLPEEAQS